MTRESHPRFCYLLLGSYRTIGPRQFMGEPYPPPIRSRLNSLTVWELHLLTIGSIFNPGWDPRDQVLDEHKFPLIRDPLLIRST